MNRVEMIRLIQELTWIDWTNASDDYFRKLWIAREEKLEETVKNAPPEWLPVAIDLLLNYPSWDEERSAFPRPPSPAVSGRERSVRITKGRRFAAQNSSFPAHAPANAPPFATPSDVDDWLNSLCELLDLWAKYAPKQVIAALAPIVEKRGKQLAYGCRIAAETKEPTALPILKAGIADFESMEDEDIATLLGAVVCMPGAEAECLRDELKQKIFALPTIGMETAEMLRIFNIQEVQRR